MSIKVTILKKKEVDPTTGKTTESFIHFSGDLRKRFKALAVAAGYNRKENEFGVMLFEQALALAEQDFTDQTAPADDSENKE